MTPTPILCLKAEPFLAAIAFSIGLVVTFLLGLGVRRVVDAVKIPAPPSLDLGTEVGGRILGHLERLLFFASLWLGRLEVAGAWATFKLATKWHGWKYVIRPEERAQDEQQFPLAERHRWGSRVVSRFLIGTLSNALAGFAGAAAGRFILDIFK